MKTLLKECMKFDNAVASSNYINGIQKAVNKACPDPPAPHVRFDV
jgi:hypothetical protein